MIPFLKEQRTLEEVRRVLVQKFNAIEHTNLSRQEIDSDMYGLNQDTNSLKLIYIVSDPAILNKYVSTKEKLENEQFNKAVEESGIDYHNKSICPELSRGNRIYIVLESVDHVHFSSFRILGKCKYIADELMFLKGIKDII
nr:hypothetical protein [uncultured Niameybacter sp.]